MVSRGRYEQAPGPLDRWTRIDELLEQSVSRLNEISKALTQLIGIMPQAGQRPSTQLMEPSSSEANYSIENITQGTFRVLDTNIHTTPDAADCRFWNKITVSIYHTGTYNIYVQLKGGSTKAPTEGADLGNLITMAATAERRFVNLGDDYWAPYVYATIYNPDTSTSFPSELIIDVIKRK